MKAYKAIIFDMDGTLFDTEKFCFHAWDVVNEKFNVNITKEVQFGFVGQSKTQIIEILGNLVEDEKLARKMFDYHVQYREKYMLEKGLPQKGNLKEMLMNLKKSGYKLAIATSSMKKQTNLNLKSAEINEYFDVIVCGDEVLISKPNPEIYTLASKRLCVSEKQCLVIEDSINGVTSAYNAGMDVIMIPDIIPANEHVKKMTIAILFQLNELLTWL